MKKRFFRAITLLLAAAVVLGMLVFSPVASAESSGGWVYEVINGGALIVGYYGPAGDITVPSSIGGYPVTGLNGELFMDNKSITGITIADSVFSIGGKAFSGCTNLTKIKLPSSLKTIDPWTFFECKKLTSLTIPANVTSIGNAAFRGCEKLGVITIPNKVTKIGNGAFLQCASLKTVTIPDSVAIIGENAFAYCTSLTSVTIGRGVMTLDPSAFYGCSALKDIYFKGTREMWKSYGEIRVPNGATVHFEEQGSFWDVPADAYYAGPVKWAVGKGITAGTGEGKFSPEEGCTRAQVVTLMWRAAGSPEDSSNIPFNDVFQSDYFYKPVKWAIFKKITTGTTYYTFSPSETCTRAQIVTFLWRSKGSPYPGTTDNPFTDVNKDDYFYKAVLWAVKNGVTVGTTETTFSPYETCTRGQVVTFLFRAS